MLFLEILREIPGKSPFNLYKKRTPEEMFSQNSKTGHQGNGSRCRPVPCKCQLNHGRADPAGRERSKSTNQSSKSEGKKEIRRAGSRVTIKCLDFFSRFGQHNQKQALNLCCSDSILESRKCPLKIARIGESSLKKPSISVARESCGFLYCHTFLSKSANWQEDRILNVTEKQL